jgi:putative ABC transport system permease protein
LGITGVRIGGANFQTSLKSIEDIWKKFLPGSPFHYSFLDRSLADQYQSEQRTERIFTIFSMFAIFIACIGLFGLAAYATQLRLREISIRKVLGANAINIISMLSADFLKLIILSSLIAFPLAWWGMYSWLRHFAYRTDLSWWIFIAAALTAALIALFTISLQAAKAAFMNPVRNLRTE